MKRPKKLLKRKKNIEKAYNIQKLREYRKIHGEKDSSESCEKGKTGKLVE